MCASINKWVKYSKRISIITTEVAIGGDLWKKSVLKNFAKFTGNMPAKVSFLIKLQAETCNFIKKETLEQVFPCEFFKIFKNNFFTEHLWTTGVADCYILPTIWTSDIRPHI